MPLLYYNPHFLQHQTGNHPERGARLRVIVDFLQQGPLWQGCVQPDWSAATDDRLLAVHSPEQVETIARLASGGGGYADPDTYVSPASDEVARLASGAACDAVARIVAGESNAALCLVRPPGHHATAIKSMGFCLYNHVAVAARAALASGIERLLIVDWDVHHGNGTQDIFYADGQVGFFSAHRAPFYPGTGAETETGTGPGKGWTRNLEFETGVTRSDYLDRFQRELKDFAERINPQLILISAGFDAHRLDPIGSLGLETEDFATLTQIVRSEADQYASGRIVSLLEGGYRPQTLAECVSAHLAELM